MASIYISHSTADAELAGRIAAALRATGQDVWMDSAELVPGTDWRAALTTALSRADIILVLLTPRAETSKWVMSEIGAARAYQQSRGDVALLPVLIGGVAIPPLLSDIQGIIALEEDVDAITQQVLAAVDRLIGLRAAKRVEREEIQERIERNAADYIDEALIRLTERETRHRRAALAWYGLGVGSLLAGIGAALWLSVEALGRLTATQNQWPVFAFMALKSVIIIGLLVAASKYAFSLGKSHMGESLKNSDRIHAISFGKFYLKAFGDKANWTEIKEVFQHWNIAKESAFTALDSKEWDPNFVGAALELAKVIAAREEKPDKK